MDLVQIKQIQQTNWTEMMGIEGTITKKMTTTRRKEKATEMKKSITVMSTVDLTIKVTGCRQVPWETPEMPKHSREEDDHQNLLAASKVLSIE